MCSSMLFYCFIPYSHVHLIELFFTLSKLCCICVYLKFAFLAFSRSQLSAFSTNKCCTMMIVRGAYTLYNANRFFCLYQHNTQGERENEKIIIILNLKQKNISLWHGIMWIRSYTLSSLSYRVYFFQIHTPKWKLKTDIDSPSLFVLHQIIPNKRKKAY